MKVSELHRCKLCKSKPKSYGRKGAFAYKVACHKRGCELYYMFFSKEVWEKLMGITKWAMK